MKKIQKGNDITIKWYITKNSDTDLTSAKVLLVDAFKKAAPITSAYHSETEEKVVSITPTVNTQYGLSYSDGDLKLANNGDAHTEPIKVKAGETIDVSEYSFGEYVLFNSSNGELVFGNSYNIVKVGDKSSVAVSGITPDEDCYVTFGYYPSGFNGYIKKKEIVETNYFEVKYYGKDQTTLGKYNLMLVNNCCNTNMNTLNYVGAFILCGEIHNRTSMGADEATINTEVVDIASDISNGWATDLSDYYTKEEIDALISPFVKATNTGSTTITAPSIYLKNTYGKVGVDNDAVLVQGSTLSVETFEKEGGVLTQIGTYSFGKEVSIDADGGDIYTNNALNYNGSEIVNKDDIAHFIPNANTESEGDGIVIDAPNGDFPATLTLGADGGEGGSGIYGYCETGSIEFDCANDIKLNTGDEHTVKVNGKAVLTTDDKLKSITETPIAHASGERYWLNVQGAKTQYPNNTTEGITDYAGSIVNGFANTIGYGDRQSQNTLTTGIFNKVGGNVGLVAGSYNTINGENKVVLGRSNYATANNTFIVGNGCIGKMATPTTNGYTSIFGNLIKSDVMSTAMGTWNHNSGTDSFTVGVAAYAKLNLTGSGTTYTYSNVSDMNTIAASAYVGSPLFASNSTVDNVKSMQTAIPAIITAIDTTAHTITVDKTLGELSGKMYYTYGIQNSGGNAIVLGLGQNTGRGAILIGEGYNTGYQAQLMGTHLNNTTDYATVLGRFNEGASNRPFAIGAGTSASNRKDILYSDASGDIFVKQSLIIGTSASINGDAVLVNGTNADSVDIYSEDSSVHINGADETFIGCEGNTVEASANTFLLTTTDGAYLNGSEIAVKEDITAAINDKFVITDEVADADIVEGKIYLIY